MTLPFYPFYWGDYSSKTFELSMLQHGAYLLLLRFIYTTGRSIPKDKAYSIAKALLPEEREAVDFILSNYFKLTKHGWGQNRAIEIMEIWEQKHKRRVNAGKSPKKTGENSGSNASELQGQRPNNHNHNQNHNQSYKEKINKKEKGKGKPAQAAKPNGARVVVRENSDAWEAWKKFKGKSSPVTDIRLDDGSLVRGWYFPSEFPPTKKKEEK